MDVGAELRKAREQRGLSLEELTRRTKISLAALRAIEYNDIHHLPGGIFTRGFLKAYAREVGLDPGAVTERFFAQFEPPPPALNPSDVATPPLDGQNRQPRRLSLPAWSVSIDRQLVLRGAVALGLLAAFYFALAHGRGRATSGAGEGRPAATASAAAERSQRGGTATKEAAGMTGSSDAAVVSVGTSGAVLRIELQLRERCWISATADGKRVVYQLMRADDRQTIESRNELVLRVGEPANLRWSINGSPARPVGHPGTPTTVRITRQNYRTFLEQ